MFCYNLNHAGLMAKDFTSSLMLTSSPNPMRKQPWI